MVLRSHRTFVSSSIYLRSMSLFLRCVFTKSTRRLLIFPEYMNPREFTTGFGIIIPYSNKHRALYGMGIHRTFCGKPLKPDDNSGSFAMETFVKNLQSQIKISNSKSGKAVGVALDVTQPAEAVVSKRKKLPPAFKEDRECDIVIQNMLKGNGCPVEILAALHSFTIKDKFPSRATLLKLAGACASKGHVEGIQAVSNVCEIAYPRESIWQMNYRHYEAEAHWKNGNIEQSLKIFHDLFEMYPLQRRKITNLTTFLMRHVINNNLVKFYPKLEAFVDFCIHHQEFVPAANLWRVAFCSESYQANCFAQELLTKHSKSLLPIVKGKVPAILSEAQIQKQMDVIQRLMNFVLSYKLDQLYSLVFGGCMDYQCNAKDVDGALQTFYFLSQSNIIISAEIMQKFQNVLALHKKKSPNVMLSKIEKPLLSNFKF